MDQIDPSDPSTTAPPAPGEAPFRTVPRKRGRPAKGDPVPKTCLHCGGAFLAPPSKSDIYHFCSDRCRWAFHDAKAERITGADPTLADVETPAVVAEKVDARDLPVAPRAASSMPMTKALALASARPLSPAVTARLRGRIASSVAEHLELANQVIEGRISWTPVQARVFSALLNKVVPDLSASHVTHENIDKDPTKLSREALERIALGLDDVIEGTATEDGKTKD